MNSKAVLITAAAALLTACGGPSSYNTAADPPVAVAHVIGQQATSAAGADPVTATVRAQSQVTLTGNASSGGAAAIGNFSWTQSDGSSAPAVTLLYLDSDTVTFTAPPVSRDTTLHFTLTVTTAGNAAASAHVSLLVKAALDSDQFLAPLAAQHFFKVAVSTQEGLGALATPAAALSGDVPLCISVSRTIDYVARDGIAHTVTLTPLHADTAWSAAIGGAPAALGSYSNPRVAFAIPTLNQDDLAVMFNNPVPGESASAAAARLAQQLVTADVDSAHLSLTAAAAAGSCDGASSTTALAAKTLQLQVLDQNGNPVGGMTSATAPGSAATSAVFSPDQLVSQAAGAAASQYETADTARAYYDAIDPAGAKTTLTAWLDANCFDAAAANYGADAHSIYTNNYDLGFGRDMYFVACKPASGKVGDSAAVVINYASLEAAATKLNPVIAVAMEYSAAADGSNPTRRFPKYYVFAPDDRDGTFHRILSANFDHRGEKYVPGACVACHGGTLPSFPANFAHPSLSATTYPTVPDPTRPGSNLGLGDVDSAFMPWDLDSFLYSDTDPSFVGLSVSPSLYTRAAQEPSLKSLNQLAYCTYQPEVENGAVDRFATVRQLVGRWYGNPTGAADTGCVTTGKPTESLLPHSTYADTASTPAGWTAQSADGQAAVPTATSDVIYHQVLARNCRACHSVDALPQDQFGAYQDFIHAFQPNAATHAAGTGLQYVFKQARMPLARLTADRFWVDYAGGTSAATLLATQVQQVNGETDLVNTTANAAIGPGAPVTNLNVTGAGIQVPIQFTPYGSHTATLPRFGGVAADATTSYFDAAYDWSLCVTPTAGGVCTAKALVGATTAMPGFANDAAGEYDLKLIASNAAGGQATSVYKFTVAAQPPTLANCPSTANGTVGATVSLNFSSCITPGVEPVGPPAYNVLQIQDPSTLAWSNGVVAATWTATVTGSAVAFTFNNQATAGESVPVNYRVTDVGGVDPTGTFTVSLIDTLTAAPDTLVFAPASAYAIAASGACTAATPGLTCNDTIVPVGDTGVTLVLTSTTTSLGASVGPASIGLTGSYAYVPPGGIPPATFLTCDINGNDIATGGACLGDQFSYTLLSGNGVTSSAPAQVTVKIKATTSFSRTSTASDVYTILGNCSGCHVTGGPAPAPTKWLYGTAASTYASITGAPPATNSINWTAFEADGATAATSPSDAALYSNVCVASSTHYNANFHLTSGCSTLLQWLTEGAHND